jgi:hypothetical protein
MPTAPAVWYVAPEVFATPAIHSVTVMMIAILASSAAPLVSVFQTAKLPAPSMISAIKVWFVAHRGRACLTTSPYVAATKTVTMDSFVVL